MREGTVRARRLAGALAVACAAGGAAALPAAAHPHVWVTGRTEIIVTDGAVTALKHRWTFDEMFSVMAAQGQDADGDGTLSREELAPLAEINVTSLREYDFFTFMSGDFVSGDKGDDAVFEEPVDYWVESANDRLTLNFTLPLATPVAVDAGLEISIYDPTYYVAFTFARKAPLTLSGAPEPCRAGLERADGPDVAGAAPGLLLSGADFVPSPEYAESYAQTLTITCE